MGGGSGDASGKGSPSVHPAPGAQQSTAGTSNGIVSPNNESTSPGGPDSGLTDHDKKLLHIAERLIDVEMMEREEEEEDNSTMKSYSKEEMKSIAMKLF